MRRSVRVVCCCAIAITLNGCGGSSSPPPPPPQITATLSPSSLSFANTVLETNSVAQSLTLTNNSGTSLSISSITATGPFSQVNNCFGSLAANASCTINVTFSPAATGSASGSLTVMDSATNSPQTASLTGTGIPGFAPTGSMSTGRGGQTSTLLENGTVVIAAGANSTFPDGTNTAEVYNPGTGMFAPTGNLPTSFFGATATLLGDGKVLIAGGTNGPSIANAELYDPATGTFAPTGNMTTTRSFHTATLLRNGKVLIAGGTGLANGASAELYDPATGRFTVTGSMVNLRWFHTATLLNNGMVLIAGGTSLSSGLTLASAELYDPASGTFAATGNMTTARSSLTALLLNNGEVLIVGGNSGSGASTIYSATAELYNPTTASFILTGNMSVARAGHTSTLLNDGMVLIAGGSSSNTSGPLASAELYDANLGTFAITANMTTARAGHSATLLTNGNVLIAGGAVGTSASTCELYLAGSAPPAGLVSIAIAPSGVTISSGRTQQFVATGTFSDNSTEVLQSVIWSSSNQAVAVISNDASNHGMALALTAGTSTITATAGSIHGSTQLTVQ
jgi:energy-coupling factor transporter ATP-binding protein EcfA2